MNLYLFILSLFSAYSFVNNAYMKTFTKMKSNSRLVDQNKEVTLTIDQLISQRGYVVESHQVITEDGYILKLFRILPKKIREARRAVLLQHGLFVKYLYS